MIHTSTGIWHLNQCQGGREESYTNHFRKEGVVLRGKKTTK